MTKSKPVITIGSIADDWNCDSIIQTKASMSNAIETVAAIIAQQRADEILRQLPLGIDPRVSGQVIIIRDPHDPMSAETIQWVGLPGRDLLPF